ncbi:MAG: protein-L-isoaspartate(D-aspartate) O-methyltransferase [Gemmatimonadetes bacterium]|nr:protein-L-isoaspartate(D-aspartate) O-methyltransferase [Gemmatimonadota bacterium]
MDDPYLRDRRRMVEQDLRRRGIRDARVLDAMTAVPRHRFVPSAELEHAYEDRALPLDVGQTISQPYIVGYMTELLRVEPAHRVLGVGTGSGYQTAVLAWLATEVFTVERIGDLQGAAGELLEDLGVANVRFKVGDGTLGWAEHAPYDRILVTAGAPDVPAHLKNQLVENGGRMVIPVGDADLQELVAVTRMGNQWTSESLMGCRFVPLVGDEGW